MTFCQMCLLEKWVKLICHKICLSYPNCPLLSVVQPAQKDQAGLVLVSDKFSLVCENEVRLHSVVKENLFMKQEFVDSTGL